MSANAALQPVREEGWRSGFSNLLAKELGLWWGTRRWWKTALFWILVQNGLVALILFAAKADPAELDGQSPLQLAATVFFQLGTVATAIAATVSTQDSIIGERQMGTAAWILSKPVSRQAFVLTKAVASAVSMISLAVVLPALVFLLEVQVLTGSMPSVVPFAGAVGIHVVHLVFYQALSLMLGTLYQTRGRVIGIGLGVILGGQLVTGFAPFTQFFTPWGLGTLGGLLVGGSPVPAWAPAPVVATAVCIPVFLAIAVGRFIREEL